MTTQVNSTVLGTLGNLTVTNNISVGGNITANVSGTLGNLTVTNNVSVGGNITANVSGFSIGYRDLPQVTAGNVTLALTDASKHFYANTGTPTTITVPSNANVAFPLGTTIVVINKGLGNISVAKQVEVGMYLAGNSTSATRTLTSYGMATLVKTETNVWFINGTGLV